MLTKMIWQPQGLACRPPWPLVCNTRASPRKHTFCVLVNPVVIQFNSVVHAFKMRPSTEGVRALTEDLLASSTHVRTHKRMRMGRGREMEEGADKERERAGGRA